MSDMSLEVLREKPEGWPGWRTGDVVAVWTVAGRDEWLQFCKHCDGWIKARPDLSRVREAMGLLAGRSGMAYHCARCGKEILFLGVRS